jgi:hypothetical protein
MSHKVLNFVYYGYMVLASQRTGFVCKSSRFIPHRLTLAPFNGVSSISEIKACIFYTVRTELFCLLTSFEVERRDSSMSLTSKYIFYVS